MVADTFKFSHVVKLDTFDRSEPIHDSFYPHLLFSNEETPLPEKWVLEGYEKIPK